MSSAIMVQIPLWGNDLLCDSSCKHRCGNGVVESETPFLEACDKGIANSSCNDDCTDFDCPSDGSCTFEIGFGGEAECRARCRIDLPGGCAEECCTCVDSDGDVVVTF